MYEYKPAPGLLPVMPGTRLYGVDTEEYVLEDEEYYAEGIVVTNDSLKVVVCGDICELGDEYFLSPEDALEWIEKNRKPTTEELFRKALQSPIWQEGIPPEKGWYLFKFSDGTMRNAYIQIFDNNEHYCYCGEDYSGFLNLEILEWAFIPDYLTEELKFRRYILDLEEKHHENLYMH